MLAQKATGLVDHYPEDLQPSLPEDLSQFSEILETSLWQEDETKSKGLRMYRLLIEKKLEECFPNVELVLRMYISMMVSNCTGERDHSPSSN